LIMKSQDITGDQAAKSIWSLVRRQPLLTSMVAIALVGIGISAYLTTIHYTHTPPVCTVTGIINCSNVLKSSYSVIPGTTIPITFPGAAWFLVSGVLALVGLVSIQRNQREPERLPLYQVLWATAGLAFVLYLIYDEFVQLHYICEWCTAVHILTFATFILALYRFTGAGRVEQAYAQAYHDTPRQAHQRRTGSVHGYALPRSARSKSAARRSPAKARNRHG
jgi:uncharacterized membrane protein